MAKLNYKTNEQLLKSFLKNASDESVAMARAILVHNAEDTLSQREAVIETYQNSIISGEMMVQCAEDVVKYLGFEKK